MRAPRSACPGALALLAAAVGAVGSGCAATPWVGAAEPGHAASRPSLDGVRVELTRLSTSPRAELEASVELRRLVLRHLAARVEAGTWVDAPWTWSEPDAAPSPDVLRLEVDVEADHSRWRTWALDALGATGVWPLVPQWGEAEVRVRASLRGPDGTPLWVSGGSGRAPYSIAWWSWFRPGPVEDAYRAALGEALEELGAHLAMSAEGLRHRRIALARTVTR
jgi:hypothetical protein